MKTIKFTIPGRPIGYYAVGKHPNWTRMNIYHKYKMAVQWHAKLSGVALPLIATKDCPVDIKTTAYFYNGVHADPENIRKGISDALFYKSPTGDKYCGGSFAPPLYDKENPRVEVEINFFKQ